MIIGFAGFAVVTRRAVLCFAWITLATMGMLASGAGHVAAQSSSAAKASAHPRPRPKAALTFSTLVLRLETEDEIGVVREELRVFVLEQLRMRGFNAVGAESLVFGTDL